MKGAGILVVEDEGIVALDLEQRLTALGYRVVGTTDCGETAVRLVEQLRPDLVLMDIRLRGEIDGITAGEQIRARNAAPVIYLTAHAEATTLERAQATEPYGYLLKPFDERELRAAIEMAVYKHRAERRLLDSEERYVATLNSIGEAVIATDAVGTVTFLNAVAEATTGWRKADAQGRSLDEVFRGFQEKTRQPAPNPIAPVLQLGVSRALVDRTLLVTPDAREVPVEGTVCPIQDQNGTVHGAVLVFRDVTAARRAEEQLRQAQKMEAIGQLAGGVAHDFNNLLTVITGYADLMRTGMPDDHPWASLLTEIRKAGERAADLTRQLLMFSRKDMVRPRLLDLNQVVQRAEKMLRRLIGEDIELKTVFDPDLPAVTADPGQIEQVLLNLAANARDAMPRGGQLRIETKAVTLSPSVMNDYPGLRPGPHACLCISDNGHGMTPEVQARIFEPFYTTKELGKGTGLGLATVYGIVKQCGGCIDVVSEPGQGTTFTIHLPPGQTSRSASVPNLGQLELPKGSETILVVEDEEGVRAFVRQILQACGYTILEASNGVNALRVSGEYTGPIDLVVTDVVMPLMNGPEMLSLLAPQRPEMKILYISGYLGADILRYGLSRDDLKMLDKPFSALGLAQRVRAVLDASHTGNATVESSDRKADPSDDSARF